MGGSGEVVREKTKEKEKGKMVVVQSVNIKRESSDGVKDEDKNDKPAVREVADPKTEQKEPAAPPTCTSGASGSGTQEGLWTEPFS